MEAILHEISITDIFSICARRRKTHAAVHVDKKRIKEIILINCMSHSDHSIRFCGPPSTQLSSDTEDTQTTKWRDENTAWPSEWTAWRQYGLNWWIQRIDAACICILLKISHLFEFRYHSTVPSFFVSPIFLSRSFVRHAQTSFIISRAISGVSCSGSPPLNWYYMKW